MSRFTKDLKFRLKISVEGVVFSERDMKSFSAGCISYGTYAGATCGVGISWIKTDLFGVSYNYFLTA